MNTQIAAVAANRPQLSRQLSADADHLVYARAMCAQMLSQQTEVGQAQADRLASQLPAHVATRMAQLQGMGGPASVPMSRTPAAMPAPAPKPSLWARFKKAAGFTKGI